MLKVLMFICLYDFGYLGFIFVFCLEFFISSWMFIRFQMVGFFVVYYYLGEYFVKVDVQLNVIKDGEEYIFFGIGMVQ